MERRLEMKGVININEEKLKAYFLNLNEDELRIITKGLGILQLQYIFRLEEVEKDTIDYSLVEIEFNKVNLCITAIKKIKNEKH